ncbi:MAG: hypothetical protein ACREL5_13005, partial [Gemmatimonadales bacterium]
DQADVAVPDAVRARVRGDYQRRLDQVTAGLRAHIDVVAKRLADDRTERDGLVARATTAREALAEAELRHAVGEYDDTHYENERSRFAGEIESLDVSAAAITEGIDRLEEVHALADRAPADLESVPGGGDDQPVAGSPDDITVTVEEETVAIADLSPDAETEEALAVFDEAAAIGSVDEPEAESAAPAELGPLTFRPSGTAPDAGRTRGAPRPPTFEHAPQLGIPAADVPPRFVRPGERIRPGRPAPAVVPPAAETSHAGGDLMDQEIVASGPTPEVPMVPVGRTLRCSECGAMNRPLEWYCEKCGAELTAV